MLYLDDRAAQVYADMHADLEAERVGHRVPVQPPRQSRLAPRFLSLRSALHRSVASLRHRLLQRGAAPAKPQEQCC